MKKAIFFESRTTNSSRVHFNRRGDWRPRVIVWPEYDGLSKDQFEETGRESVDDDTDETWGGIIAGTLARFQQHHSLSAFAYERAWPNFWERIIHRFALPHWKKCEKIDLTAAYVNERQHCGHDSPVFLLAPAMQLPSVIRELILDRTNLLPMGEAIFEFGIEEAVLEITFAKHESSFLEILGSEAQTHGHEYEETVTPFISHWVVANHKNWDLGDNWRVF